MNYKEHNEGDYFSKFKNHRGVKIGILRDESLRNNIPEVRKKNFLINQ